MQRLRSRGEALDAGHITEQAGASASLAYKVMGVLDGNPPDIDVTDRFVSASRTTSLPSRRRPPRLLRPTTT